MRHLLSTADLDRPAAVALLDTAEELAATQSREIRKLPTLRGKTLGAIPTLRVSHLLPLALLAGMSAAVVAFPKVRNSLVIRLAMLASSRLVPTPRYPGERPDT